MEDGVLPHHNEKNGGITMKRKLLSVILALTMLLSSAAVLASCVNEEQPTETETEKNTETSTDSGDSADTGSQTETGASDTESTDSSDTGTGTESGSETGTTEIETETSYGNGEEIKDAGVVWADDSFANTSNTIDESKAVNKTAEEMLALLTDKEALKQGEVYKVTEPLVLSSNTKYYGNLAAVIAEGGILIENAEEVVIKELIIKGNITVKNSTGITLFRLDLTSTANSVTADSKSSDIAIKSCRINSTGTAIKSDADNAAVLGSYIIADKGIISTGDNFSLHSSQIDAVSLGVSSSGDYCTVKNNTISADKGGKGVVFGEGSVNGLVALNVVKNAQTSISVEKGFNCVVLLNSAVTIEGTGNTNLYVVKNSLGGLVKLSANKYLLCDENTFPNDGLKHPVISLDNSEYNGDNLHDVNARVEYGANEELLPHTNKELFVGMERHSNVRDASITKTYSFNNYIRAMAKQGSVVIVPPGAYSVSGALALENAHSNTTIYAFGVYEEKDCVPDGETKFSGTVTSAMGMLLNISGSSINVHGLTIGYEFQSSGQAYVLDKWQEGNNYFIRVIPGAGWGEDFCDSDENIYGPSKGIQMCKGDMTYSWMNFLGYIYVGKESDGTMVYRITHGGTKASEVYSTIEKGDILGCRLEGDNSRSINITGSNALLKDCVLYGYSAALAVVANGAGAENIRLERFHNTTKSAPVIDKATYDKYKALEKQYGMTGDGDDPTAEGAQGLEVYIDAAGRYRGGLPRYGSVDATHVYGAAQGISATSCILEHMVDDGSNQRSSSSRVAGVKDNGDGTTTVYIKGSLALVYHNIHTAANKTSELTGNCAPFREGDMLFAYASNGKVFAETEVLSASEDAGTLPNGINCHMIHVDSNKDCVCDICKATMHTDVKKSNGSAGRDCKCDNCGTTVHTDYSNDEPWAGKGDGICEGCGKTLADSNADGLNDSDKTFIITDMANPAQTTYDPATSTLKYKVLTSYGYITYSCKITKVTVKTSEINLDAIKGIDFTENNTYMENKVTCDNVSLNSANFTFDNVLMQEYHSRGILMKTRDSVAKNCTFRNVALTGMLLSVETRWGESSVPKNITIEGCEFDNVGHSYQAEKILTYAPIAIQGLGDITFADKEIAEDNLPCENIKIIGNRFINTNNYYVISITDAQNVEIKDNYIECRTKMELGGTRVLDKDGNPVGDDKYGRAIYIERCININISGNEYHYGGDKVAKGTHIIAWDYKNLDGTDLYDAEGNRFASLPIDKADKKPTT